jgi:nucleoside-diphosphate-sugar epimerase
MKIIVVGAGGTIGKAVVDTFEQAQLGDTETFMDAVQRYMLCARHFPKRADARIPLW